MNKDCNQCKGSGLVADLPQFPKPAWEAWENRPKAGPDPMTDFVKSVPCPSCCPDDHLAVALDKVAVEGFAAQLRSKAVGYRKRAESLDGLAEVAEKMIPGSDAERAFMEFVKTQGVEL